MRNNCQKLNLDLKIIFSSPYTLVRKCKNDSLNVPLMLSLKQFKLNCIENVKENFTKHIILYVTALYFSVKIKIHKCNFHQYNKIMQENT